jgi:hypothetical protein
MQLNQRQDLTNLHYLTETIYVDHDEQFDEDQPYANRMFVITPETLNYMDWDNQKVRKFNHRQRVFDKKVLEYRTNYVKYSNNYINMRSTGTMGIENLPKQIQTKGNLEKALNTYVAPGFSSFGRRQVKQGQTPYKGFYNRMLQNSRRNSFESQSKGKEKY